MYRVATYPRFKKAARAELSPEEFRRLEDLYDRVALNPFIGDPLGPVWFREVRFKGKRLYFIIKNDVVLFVDASDKDDQQDVIDDVREHMSFYEDYAESTEAK